MAQLISSSSITVITLEGMLSSVINLGMTSCEFSNCHTEERSKAVRSRQNDVIKSPIIEQSITSYVLNVLKQNQTY